MDSDTMSLLNLSPIPELSELEISTILDQLSGLSDVNGEMTDQNVEDILKEAEVLMGTSSRVKQDKAQELVVGNCDGDMVINIIAPKENETKNEAPGKPLEMEVGSKHYNTPARSEEGENKEEKSPSSVRIFSPGSSSNHIKCTIDSLKEYSNMMEKQINYELKNSPKSEGKKEADVDIETILRDGKTKLMPTVKVQKTTKPNREPPKKKTISGPLHTDKSVKLLNCFERLYRDKPVRLSGSCQKSKATDKIPKKKIDGDVRDGSGGRVNKPVISDKNIQGGGPFLRREQEEYLSGRSKTTSIVDHRKDLRLMLPLRLSEDEEEGVMSNCPKQESLCSYSVFCTNQHSHGVEGKLILKLLKEIEEIKEQVKKAEVFANHDALERIMRGSQAVIDSLPTALPQEMEINMFSEKAVTTGIKGLEERFTMLKEKYDVQMEQLEAENRALKEAMTGHQKYLIPHSRNSAQLYPDVEYQIDPENPKSMPSQTWIEKRTAISSSLETCEIPKSTRLSDAYTFGKDIKSGFAIKDAFSQTEKELRNVSIQCADAPEREEVPSRERAKATGKEDLAVETENKENLTRKNKSTKSKPFAEVHQLTKQKKGFSYHETQLLATLRGLQSEMTLKDKENRKLKTEINLLKTQIRRLTKNKSDGLKGEGIKRNVSNIGTQTIALGPVVQGPYNSSIYEVTDDWEKENEELKARIMALEEDFQILKEKRICDLQSLHQVHEEEMSRLVSKLETQTALTKHLHSMLFSR